MKELPNLGIIGKMGSGKGFAARYLSRKYGYSVITMSNFVRALARKEHMRPTRENLEKLQKKYSVHGDYVMEKVLMKASKTKKPVILDGIRKPLQAKLAKGRLKALLIEVDADPKIRFERIRARGRKSDIPRTLGEFKKLEGKEEKVFRINRTLSMADFRINNDDGAVKLYKNLDSLMRKIK